jgi:hypothetical protein
MNQTEEVQPVATSMEFGIDNTVYGLLNYDRVQYVRRDIRRAFNNLST